MFWTVKSVHFSISAGRTPREPKTILSPVMVVKGNAVVQSRVRVKAISILIIAKLVIDIVNLVHNILLLQRHQQLFRDEVQGTYTKPIIQASGLQPVEIEGRLVELEGDPGKRRAQISPGKISDRMRVGRAEPAAQTLRFCRKRGTRGLHQMGRGVGNCSIRSCRN